MQALELSGFMGGEQDIKYVVVSFFLSAGNIFMAISRNLLLNFVTESFFWISLNNSSPFFNENCVLNGVQKIVIKNINEHLRASTDSLTSFIKAGPPKM